MLGPTCAFLTGGTFSERKCIFHVLFLLPWIKFDFGICPEDCCSICKTALKLGFHYTKHYNCTVRLPLSKSIVIWKPEVAKVSQVEISKIIYWSTEVIRKNLRPNDCQFNALLRHYASYSPALLMNSWLKCIKFGYKKIICYSVWIHLDQFYIILWFLTVCEKWCILSWAKTLFQ